MTYYLDFRTRDVGGAVIDPRLVRSDDGDPDSASWTILGNDAVASVVSGRDLLFAAHGFNVPRHRGAPTLYALDRYLALPPPSLFIGLLWPGDFWVPFVDYPFEGDVAIDCGGRLAQFCEQYGAGAHSVSFFSHSLGARLVLETIQRLPSQTRSACLTAGAINRDCLNAEYAVAGRNCARVAVLASHRDDVLKLAFSIGDPFANLLHADHAFFEAALGYDGPPLRAPGPVARPWQIPDTCDFGHLDYLPPDTPGAPPPAPNDKWPRVADFMKRAFLGQTQLWPPS